MSTRFAIIGGLLGVAVPFCYGLWLIYSVWSLPALPPGQAYSGTPAAVGFLIIAFVSPVTGGILALLGAGVGRALPWIYPQFSFRTLLIATTLFAVVLGLVVWSSG